MSSRRRQAASGSTSAAAAHAPPISNTVTPRLNPMVAAFRREVVSMLNTPPPLPRHLAHLSKEKVEVLAAFERITLHGEQQQSAQLCRVGGDDGEMWVTRTEGERYYFPNAGRVNKRARETLADEEESAPAEGDGPTDMDVEGDEQETPTARRARARAQRRNPRSNVEQDDPPSEGWFPQHDHADETPAQASTSRTRNTAAPNAPKKARRAPRQSQRDLDADSLQYDGDEGNDTEREGSSNRRAAAAKKSKKGKSKASTSTSYANANAEASGSGLGARRSARRAARDSPVVADDVFTAKREQTVDDLDSLCGGIGGFALGSSIAGSVAPEFSSASFDFASPAAEDIKPFIAGPPAIAA